MRLFIYTFCFSLNAFAYQSEAPENASLKMLGIEDGKHINLLLKLILLLII